MRATLLFQFLFGLIISATGQERVQFEAGKHPYFLVDSFTVDLKYLVLSPHNIESISVLKDSNSIAIYGDKAKYGAVIVKTKPNTKLLRIGDILAKYNVAKADQNLRICINKRIISKPELIIIDESEILAVEITTDRHWINPGEANNKEKFINIKVPLSENDL